VWLGHRIGPCMVSSSICKWCLVRPGSSLTRMEAMCDPNTRTPANRYNFTDSCHQRVPLAVTDVYFVSAVLPNASVVGTHSLCNAQSTPASRIRAAVKQLDSLHCNQIQTPQLPKSHTHHPAALLKVLTAHYIIMSRCAVLLLAALFVDDAP
jgi:hypothetical protein